MIDNAFGISALLWVQVILALLGCVVSLVCIKKDDEYAGEDKEQPVAPDTDPTERTKLLINADS